jgi:DDE superfamily endonuclease
VWCEDEAGPYQAIPQSGESWQPEGHPARQPHEYTRGGIAKLFTLFRPATGEVRAVPVERSTNAILHPWLEQELAAILKTTPPTLAGTESRRGCGWADWDWHLEPESQAESPRPALRLLVILDNLKGHHTPAFVDWCIERGILLLYTPIAGSWLNLAEPLQRIVVRRALTGQHPESATQLMQWLAAQVRGWNAHPTPFVWGGKRAARRQRAYERRHVLGGAAGYTRRPIPRRLRLAA